MKEIVIASGNKGKVAEFEKMLGGLGVRVYALSEFGEISEYEETGQTFQENACGKALYYSKMLGKVVIADDSGLEVDALAGAPGVYSARYAGVEGPGKDSANNDRLLQELNDVPDNQRTARFRCCLCMAGPDGVMAQSSGSVEGHICRAGRGTSGFGYDPLFEIPELGRTAAELEYSEKNKISHRGQAMKELMAKLKALIESDLC
ncbi:MAG: XTP/dITP diphosphatase [Sedimentisphaerales bacterium]|nr:XTP/dITP diphosphatase [Sedimentisphaerales bacterium]